MKHWLARSLLPGAVAVCGVTLLVLWAGLEPTGPLQARIPGLDRPKPGEAEANAKPLEGKLSSSDNRAPDVPGSWPRFRGLRFDGIGETGVSLAREWPASGPEKLWSIELGEGHAGAAVWNSRVYVLDYDRDASADALRCLALADGKELWRFSYPVAIKRNHGMSRTVPAVTDKYVVAFGPKCDVSCLDPMTGKSYWLMDLVQQFGATIPPWYAGQCPLIDDDKAILAVGGDALLVAIDCPSGQVAWKSPNPQHWTMTHASIVPMEFAGRKMYIYCGKGGVAGIAADDGSLLWDTTDWKISIATVPSPVVLPEGRIFLCGGYNSGSLMLQLHEDGGKIAAKTVYRLGPAAFGSTQHTPIFYDGHLFGVRERDKQLVCLDPADGRVVWSSGSQHRFGIGPYMIADGLIYVMNDEGRLTLAEASTQQYRQLAQAQVIEGHDSWGAMALAAGRLIVRDLTQMVCLHVAQTPKP